MPSFVVIAYAYGILWRGTPWPTHPVLSNLKKPRKYRVQSSIVLSREIILPLIIFMIPIFVTVFVKNYYIFLLKNGLLLLSNRFTFLSLDNIPGAEPINQTLKEAQDTLQSEGKC